VHSSRCNGELVPFRVPLKHAARWRQSPRCVSALDSAREIWKAAE